MFSFTLKLERDPPKNATAEPTPEAAPTMEGASAKTETGWKASRPSTATGGNEYGIIWSLVSAVVLLLIARESWMRGGSHIALAASLGALGGFTHELMQSGGWFFFQQKTGDGTRYLGTAIGLVLGAVAGVLAVQAILIAGPAKGVDIGAGSGWLYQFAYVAFAAGLSAKGLTEAATTDAETESSKTVGSKSA